MPSNPHATKAEIDAPFVMIEKYALAKLTLDPTAIDTALLMTTLSNLLPPVRILNVTDTDCINEVIYGLSALAIPIFANRLLINIARVTVTESTSVSSNIEFAPRSQGAFVSEDGYPGLDGVRGDEWTMEANPTEFRQTLPMQKL